MESLKTIEKCRLSGSDNLVSILDLGDQPLANTLKIKPDDPEDRYPLTLLYSPESCLAQIGETIDKEKLFCSYPWVTGTSPSTRCYASQFFRQVKAIARPAVDDLIIEIASNDGTFLIPFLRHGYHNVIGVDPARNIVDLARRQGVRTLCRFWGRETSKEIVSASGHARIIIARNVLPHVSAVHDVVAGIAHALANTGIGVIEFHYAGRILEDLHYDSIYHEHLFYFSIKSISLLLALFDLVPFHLDTSPISGGSYVIYFSKTQRPPSETFLKLMQEEELARVNEIASWQVFATSCHRHRDQSIEMAKQFASKTVIGFGASARSSTYLNFCGFGVADIRAIIDNNSFKQGKYSPGSSIPIVDFEKGMQMNPDLILILAWNFRDEIVQQCRAAGYKGDFMVPFPRTPYFFNESR